MFGPDFGKEEHEFVLVIRYDLKTGEREISGCDKNPVVAMGLLDYVLARVRRFIVQAEMAQEIKEAPRVSLSHRLVQ